MIKKGYKQTEIGFIPEDWDILELGKLFSFYSTSNYSKAEMFLDGEVGCIHYGLIHAIPNSNYNLKNGIRYFVTKEQAKYEFLKDGDVIMVDASEDLVAVNKSIELLGVSDKKYIAGLHTFLLRDEKSQLAAKFRGAILNSSLIKKQLVRLAVGMKVFGVSKPQLRTVLIPLPTKSEQTAIANALSDADAYISSLEKLIAKKRLIKQGAMQQLLTCRKRINGFYKKWDTKVFTDICELHHGFQFRKEDFIEQGEGVKVIKIGNVQEGGFNTADCDFIDIKRLDKFRAFLIKNGDILMSLTGNIGRVVKVKGINEPLLQNYRVGKFVPKDVDANFLSYILSSSITTTQLEALSNQTSQANFGKSEFDKIIVTLPSEKSEQIAISNILIDMDNEISSIETKLTKAKQIKQGMMQNLLTGKIRLV